MAAKLTRLTHKIAIQLHLVAESCSICSSRSRWTHTHTHTHRTWWKLKLSLCLGIMQWRHGEAEIHLHTFLILVSDDDEWSASISGHCTPKVRATGTPWKGGWKK